MKILVETLVKSDAETVWNAWTDPEDIKQWNAASDDWHTTSSRVDLQVGGEMSSRMEAKDGSIGFDFTASFTKIELHRLIEFNLEDGRHVRVEFLREANGVRVREAFDADPQNAPDMQRQGWQAILDNFTRHVEAKPQGQVVETQGAT
ncbi:MAG: SRPBCC domain-containing protein [Dokdonella sp.]